MTWLALGGLGRREVVPSSDVDSALVWDGEGASEERYMRTLGARVVEELAATGFVADAHGATAAESLFDRSFNAWRSVIRTAIEHGRGQGVDLHLPPLRRPPRVRHRRCPRSARGAEPGRAPAHGPAPPPSSRAGQRPPTGLRRLRHPSREGSGDDKRRLDIKHHGVLPIAGIARYASLASGVRVTSTRARLDAAATAGTLNGRDARMLAEAYDLFWRLRLDHQVEQLRAGDRPDDRIDPEALNPVTRGYVREAFHAVSSVQRSLKADMNLPP